MSGKLHRTQAIRIAGLRSTGLRSGKAQENRHQSEGSLLFYQQDHVSTVALTSADAHSHQGMERASTGDARPGTSPARQTGMREERLQALASEVLGLNEFDAAAFSEQIDHIDVLPGMELNFTSRTAEKKPEATTLPVFASLLRIAENHVGSHEKKWTPERRTAMSEKDKEDKEEKHWASTKAKGKTIPATLSRFTASHHGAESVVLLVTPVSPLTTMISSRATRHRSTTTPITSGAGMTGSS